MKKNSYKLLKHTSGITKLLAAVSIAVMVFFLLGITEIENRCRVILAWDAFCITMITVSWLLFFTTSEKELHDVVEVQDDGLKAIFTIVLIALCISLFATLLLVSNQAEPSMNKTLYMAITFSPVLFSWILLHTIFTVRYAHFYHDHNTLDTGSNIGGMRFPSDAEPDYVDFAYFSFVIGMTFQVSDVQVNSRVIRRFVLMHSVLSFMFNTIIVAMTINTIAGFNK